MTQNTFRQDVFQQYRLLKYIRDILLNWFSDPANIQDQRLAFQLYKRGQLNKQHIKLGTAFNQQNQFIGTTPSITIQLGDITYQSPNINIQGNPNFYRNPMESPTVNVKYKIIPISIVVTTQGYDSNVVLTQLIQMFLAANINFIQADCTMLDSSSIQRVSKPTLVKAGQAANAKQLYKSQITLLAKGHIIWSTNTQGPVFQGISFNNIINKD